MRTAQEFQQQVEKYGIHDWQIGACSICDCPLYYIFEEDGEVWFDSGCDCVSTGFQHFHHRTFQHVADHYNRQSDPAVIAEMDAFWHFNK